MDWQTVKVLEQSGRPNRTCIALMHEYHCQNRELNGKISAGVYGDILYLVQSTDAATYSHRDLLFSIPERDLLRCSLRPRGAYYRVDWAERQVRVFGNSATLGTLYLDIQAIAQEELQKQLNRFISSPLYHAPARQWMQQANMVFGGRN